MRRLGCVVLLAMLLRSGLPVVSLEAKTWPESGVVRFGVTDPREKFETQIDDRLLLRIVRMPHVRVKEFGWTVEVVERPGDVGSPNLLYHSLAWHGPYPTDIMAWHEGERLFPRQRVLRMQGFPFEVRILLRDIATGGVGANKEFVSGTVEVSWQPFQPLDVRGQNRYAEIRGLIKRNLRVSSSPVQAADAWTIKAVRPHTTDADVPVLIEMLADEESAVGVGAAGLLAALGDKAVSEITAVSRSPHARIAANATEALRRIELCRQNPRVVDPDLCPAAPAGAAR